MTLDLTDAEIDAALADRDNWPLAARAALFLDSNSANRGNLAILVATIRKQAARIAELEAENERLRDIISRPFEPQSVSVPSDVVVVTPPQQNHNFSAQLACQWRR